MKHLLIAVLVVTGFSLGANAQAGFRLGVKGGLNLNQYEGQSFNNGFKYGYHLGGFAEIDFSKKIGVQPEVIWSESNTTYSSGFANLYPSLVNSGNNQNVKLNYLTIPLLLRYNVGSMVTLLAGPQFGILMNKDQTVLQNGQQAFASGDFALTAGLQFNLQTLRIYGRYSAGMKNINQIDQRDKWTNQQIQLGIGLKL
ncbi:MAG: PorT family protein [Chitinophagaceae bacterium]|nr:PorT family protein [Chitinophagaceae bacterium]